MQRPCRTGLAGAPRGIAAARANGSAGTRLAPAQRHYRPSPASGFDALRRLAAYVREASKPVSLSVGSQFE
jgi:hypothetical protein